MSQDSTSSNRNNNDTFHSKPDFVNPEIIKVKDAQYLYVCFKNSIKYCLSLFMCKNPLKKERIMSKMGAGIEKRNGFLYEPLLQ